MQTSITEATVPVTRERETNRQPTDWLAVVAFGCLWLELISRLRLEWSINPQYAYGWTVPFLALYAFWRRSQNAPSPTAPSAKGIAAIAILVGAALLLPIRLVQEANPDWRLLSWILSAAVIAASAGGIYLAGGRSWLRYFAFPLLFFLVAVPWPTQFEQGVIQGLMRIVASINVTVPRWVSPLAGKQISGR